MEAKWGQILFFAPLSPFLQWIFVIVKYQNYALLCFDPGYAEIVKDVLQAIPSVFLIAK